jgi:AAA+ ATPase superfamily predicted ATPase
MFINRQDELAQLNQLYQAQGAQLFVLYGRRRVGKTELLRAFCADKPHVFFVATLTSDMDQLATFSQEIWRYQQGEAPEDFTFPSWESAFQRLATLPDRSIVVIDEFTYLIDGNKAIPSILQKVWDQRLSHSQIFLVLCGSYVGVVEREVLGYRAPLYGRRTGGSQLLPLSLPAAAAFFPTYSPVQQIEAWAVLGGMPYYLRTFSDQQDIFANIQRHILNLRGALHNEPHLLLLEELREPRNYFALLRAIAEGRRRLNEIAQATGLGEGGQTGRYLDILRQLRVVQREVPVTERQPEKSRKGLYQISDAFLRFWFRFVHPHQGSLNLGLEEATLAQRIRPAFDQFVSIAFAEAAQPYVARLARTGKLPFLPERIGRWWSESGELDLMAIGEADSSVLFGECKWTEKPVGLNILVDLQRKAQLAPASKAWRHITYALFAKSGFTPELEALAEQGQVVLVRPDEIVDDSSES